MFVINDTHLGVNRSGGTTPTSFAALNAYARNCFQELLSQCKGDSLLINGDLFDGFTVPASVLLETYSDLAHWLDTNPAQMLMLARGNHDISKDTTKRSSFDLIGAFLVHRYGDRVIVIDEPLRFDGYYVIPHMLNQDLFNAAIESVIARSENVLFLHCNYDNSFAVESDHSLNLSKEQARALTDAGVNHIILGHEHQQRHVGNVLVVGNQFPTSVADCLGNDEKRFLEIRAEGDIRMHAFWTKPGSYYQADWRKTDEVPVGAEFVRVAGTATADEAQLALDAVSKLRKSHSAFVITNAVVVDGRALDLTAIEAKENLQLFDVRKFLLDNLDNDEQREFVSKLLETEVV